MRHGGRYYSSMKSMGYDLYDNREKRRLPLSFPTREEAERFCEQKNSEQLFDLAY
ncbi:hypothetical protein PS710_04267 [Pseudomonas fluorescens]|uniref:Integrase n=1 Tax=Pseudomonas fluorescens TaxID=294 RepID=A0A5E7DUS6_PSEFL|nr:hypothetical protein PS710_04267 [Pseudomonas fluorescens]